MPNRAAEPSSPAATPGSDAPGRAAPRVVGVSFLLSLVIVVIANYGVSFRLIVPGDAAQTARNILAHPTLFRINVVCDLLYAVNVVVLLAMLYAILAPVNRPLARVAALCRGIAALMWCVTALKMLGAQRLLGDAAYLDAFGAAPLQALARASLAAGYDAYYVGLPFWGLASAICGGLWLRSGRFPKALAAFGVAASVWCVCCAFAFLAHPRFAATVNASWFDTPLVLFELAAGVWLLARGGLATPPFDPAGS